MQFFESHGDVAFPFYHNLLRVWRQDPPGYPSARRDARNIIRTQKAMKKMRELVLESEDTVVSKPVFETLEELIEHNSAGITWWNRRTRSRRWSGSTTARKSRRWSCRRTGSKSRAGGINLPATGAACCDPTGEIPVSGTVDSVGDGPRSSSSTC